MSNLIEAANMALEVAEWQLLLGAIGGAKDWLDRVDTLKYKKKDLSLWDADELKLISYVIQSNILLARLQLETSNLPEKKRDDCVSYLEQALDIAENYDLQDYMLDLRRLLIVAKEEGADARIRFGESSLKNPTRCACGDALLLIEYVRREVEICSQCYNAYHKHHNRCPHCGETYRKCPYCYRTYPEVRRIF